MLRLAVFVTLVAVSLASTANVEKFLVKEDGHVIPVGSLQKECNSVGQLGSTCPLDQFPKAKELPHCEKEENPPGYVFCSKTCCFEEGSNLPTCDLDGGLKFICT